MKEHRKVKDRWGSHRSFEGSINCLLYTSTPTNVFPSLHVFNSLAACIAIHESQELRKHRAVQWSAYVLAATIILATVFLKQHSVIDVMAAFV